MGDAEGWYANSGNEQRGPMPFDELRNLVKHGSLSRTDLVWTDGMQQWQPASSIKGLFSVPPPVQPVAVDQPRLLEERSGPAPRQTVANGGAPITQYDISVDKNILLQINSHAMGSGLAGLAAALILLSTGYWLLSLPFAAAVGAYLYFAFMKRDRIPQFHYCVRDNVLQISEPPHRKDIPLDAITSAAIMSLPVPKWFGASMGNYDTIVVGPVSGPHVSLRAVLNAQDVAKVLLSQRRS
jgi:hypothetical protein